MKKLLAIALILALLSPGFCLAQGQPDRSITQIQAEVSGGWQDAYTTAKGQTVVIDTPVVVPQVDKVPIVRVTWPEALKNLSAALTVENNTRQSATFYRDISFITPDHVLLEAEEYDNPNYTLAEAPEAFLALVKQYAPYYENEQFELGNMLAYSVPGSDYGYYQLLFYQTFHGIPFLIRSGFRYPTKTIVAVLGNGISGMLRSDNQFHVNLSACKEIKVEAEDVPLLPFEDIKKAFQTAIEGGYVQSFDEVHFGYMLFFDKAKLGKEYLLMPVWVAKGQIRGALASSFDEPDREAQFLGYNNLNILVVNAQSGELYALNTDKRQDRQYAPAIINWE